MAITSYFFCRGRSGFSLRVNAARIPILLFVAILFQSVSFVSGRTQDEEGFLEKIRLRQAQVETAVQDVVYEAVAVAEEFDSQGRLKKTTKTRRRVFVKGADLQKSEYSSLRVDGRELAGKEREKEIQRARMRSGGRRSDMPFTAAVWTNYTYTVGEKESLNGLRVRSVPFAPRQAKTGSIRGRAFVLEETGDIVRIDFKPGRSVGVIRKADFVLEYGRIGAFWFPSVFRMELIVQVEALINLAYIHVRVRENYADYRVNTGLTDDFFE